MKLINPMVIIRILSTILFIESICFLVCLPVAHIYNESAYPFIWSSLITIFFSVVFYIAGKDVNLEKISRREGFMAVSVGWFLFTGVGALPYILSGTIPSFADAFFESSSGFTTTGATILKDIEVLPHSVLFWRSLTHWIGGLGIVLLVIIILPSLKITAQYLLFSESSLKEKIHPKTKAVGMRLLYIYLGLTITEILFLWAGEMDLFESIIHTFGTVATGGFSTKNAGISAYSPYSQYVISIFMFLSGVSFVIYYYLIKFDFKKIRKNDELWFYCIAILVAGTIATSILMIKTAKPLETAFREGFFQTISIITTTGYASTDFLMWPAPGLFLIFILLFAGACTGSTTSSIKMARHVFVVKNLRNVFVRLIHPDAVAQIKVNDKSVPDNVNISTISYIILYLVIFLTGTIVLIATGTDPVTGASAVASSLGNVGPGLGGVGPMFNYSGFSVFIKLFLSVLMIIGRLEIFSVFILFAKSFWKI
ncbi:MAG: TrkH family potassium uptake protein [Bacteroidales bacterium]|nr:TrkH family potassium uptake protein [Bacteroidales bacterium]